ncbi:unnamed protein product [Pleuronectes platessa]|uniref:Uncharacterized protein n=1 Tax=Pleuronectes platessa TaxID=8262 RepID=A0A9N7VKL1_PLEPL|nr:unnamed protein product [Pleuronectes platessa]
MATVNKLPGIPQDHLLQTQRHYPGRCDLATIKGGSSLSAEIRILIKNLQMDLHCMEGKYEQEKAEKEILKKLIHTLITSSQNVPRIREIIEGSLYKKKAELLMNVVSKKKAIIKEKTQAILCLNRKIAELEHCNNKMKQTAFFHASPAKSHPVDFDQEKLLLKQIQDLKEQITMERSDNDEKISQYEQKISKEEQKLSVYEQKISEDKQKISEYQKKIQDLKEQLQMELRTSAASADKIKDMEMEHQNSISNIEQFINSSRF